MKTRLLACLALLVFAGGAAAQTRYQCRTAGGAAYLSDRPCNGQGMVYYGPAPAAPSYSSPVTRSGEAPGHLRHMSARCASLHDAIRTAPARGLKSETLSTMQRDYQRECGENESEARQQFSREQGMERQQKVAERQTQAQAVERTKLQQAQCDESKRILVTKSRRTDLSDGEKADLKRFEESYRARCA